MTIRKGSCRSLAVSPFAAARLVKAVPHTFLDARSGARSAFCDAELEGLPEDGNTACVHLPDTFNAFWGNTTEALSKSDQYSIIIAIGWCCRRGERQCLRMVEVGVTITLTDKSEQTEITRE